MALTTNDIFDLKSINDFIAKCDNNLLFAIKDSLNKILCKKLVPFPDYGFFVCDRPCEMQDEVNTLILAAYHSRLDIIEYGIHSHSDGFPISSMIKCIACIATIFDKIDVLEYLDDLGLFEIDEPILSAAFVGGNPDVINWLMGQIHVPNHTLVEICIYYGRIENLMQILDLELKNKKLLIKPSKKLLEMAIRSKSLPMVKFIFEIGLTESKFVKLDLFELCAGKGCIDIARYLIDDHNLDLTKKLDRVIAKAIYKNRLEFLKFLSGLGIDVVMPKNNKPLYMAICSGNIGIADYLVSKGALMKGEAKRLLSFACNESIEATRFVLALNPSLEQATDPLMLIARGNYDQEIIANVVGYCVDMVLSLKNSRRKKAINDLLIKLACIGLVEPLGKILPLCTDNKVIKWAFNRSLTFENEDTALFILNQVGPDVMEPHIDTIKCAIHTRNLNIVRLTIETMGCNLEYRTCEEIMFRALYTQNIRIVGYILTQIRKLSDAISFAVCKNIILKGFSESIYGYREYYTKVITLLNQRGYC
jgi:hypothetical protein